MSETDFEDNRQEGRGEGDRQRGREAERQRGKETDKAGEKTDRMETDKLRGREREREEEIDRKSHISHKQQVAQDTV